MSSQRVRGAAPVSTNLLQSTFRGRGGSSNTAVDNESFRKRNNVLSTYTGPIYVTEEVYVPCANCSAPVNPVERVPVGTSWYHPHCLHCQICKKGTRTTAFYPVNGRPVCANCHGGGGYAAIPDKRSFLADHNLLTLSNGVKLDPRTTTVRQAILMEKQAVAATHDTNFTLCLPPIRGSVDSNSPSPSRGRAQQPHALAIDDRHNNSTAPKPGSR